MSGFGGRSDMRSRAVLGPLVANDPKQVSALTRLKSHWNLILAAVNGKQVSAKMWLGRHLDCRGVDLSARAEGGGRLAEKRQSRPPSA